MKTWSKVLLIVSSATEASIIAFLGVVLFICTGCASVDNKTTYVDTSSLIYKYNKFGERQPHLGMYRIEGGKIYQTDSIGNIQYHKGAVGK